VLIDGQDRYIQEKDEYGTSKGVVKLVDYHHLPDNQSDSLSARPFVIDLESTNGTLVNDNAIPAARYYELKAGDGTPYARLYAHNALICPSLVFPVIKFGLSAREYVLLHDEASLG
jgi:smad nuclear-interacting protein 1